MIITRTIAAVVVIGRIKHQFVCCIIISRSQRIAFLMRLQISHERSTPASGTMSGAARNTNDKAITRSRNQTAVIPTKSIYESTRTGPSSDKVDSVESGSSSSRLGPIARLFSSSQRILTRHSLSASDGQAVNEEARTRWRRTHSAALHPQFGARDLQQQQRHLIASRRSLEQRAWSVHSSSARFTGDSRTHSLTVHDVVRAAGSRTRNQIKEYHQRRSWITSSGAAATAVWTESARTGTSRASELDATKAATSTFNKPGESRQRKTAVYSRDFPVEGSGSTAAKSSATQFPSVENLIRMYATMLAERKSEFAEQKMSSKSEGKGGKYCN